ncbi:MAG: hypothetical protein LBK41_07340, partial [Clostridiales bacterium]|nr:hypothetical protein [Clostridiales bacterium]
MRTSSKIPSRDNAMQTSPKRKCFEPRKIPRPDQVFAENLIEKRVAHPWNFTWFTQNSSSS